MRIFRHHRDLPPDARGAVVALGNFDGVHRGHQALIAEAERVARERGVPLAVVVFEPYPQEFFRPDAEPFRLASFPSKARLLAELDVNLLIVIHFDAEIAGMLAQDFVLDVLVGELRIAHVVVGADFRFGKGRGGDTGVLAYMGEMEGFGVTIFRPLADGPEAKISSTRIRQALRDGRPEEAARLLGHVWSIEGHVGTGDRRGRKFGYPTANMTVDGVLQPRHGVYAVRAQVAEHPHIYHGVANFGRRPTFESPTPLLEVHLFDFDGDLYGQLLRVEFVAFLREERKFENVAALKAQLDEDSAAARTLLRRA